MRVDCGERRRRLFYDLARPSHPLPGDRGRKHRRFWDFICSRTFRKSSPSRTSRQALAFWAAKPASSSARHSSTIKPTDTYARALLAGIVNTIWVSAWSVALATDHRADSSASPASRAIRFWLSLAFLYVEALRNVPLLLYLFLWYALIVTSLPPVREAWEIVPHGVPEQQRPDHPVDWSGRARIRSFSSRLIRRRGARQFSCVGA